MFKRKSDKKVAAMAVPVGRKSILGLIFRDFKKSVHIVSSSFTLEFALQILNGHNCPHDNKHHNFLLS